MRNAAFATYFLTITFMAVVKGTVSV